MNCSQISVDEHKFCSFALVMPPKGSENRFVREIKQQNKMTSAQIYFSQTNIKSFIYVRYDNFTPSETFQSGSPRSLLSCFENSVHGLCLSGFSRVRLRKSFLAVSPCSTLLDRINRQLITLGYHAGREKGSLAVVSKL